MLLDPFAPITHANLLKVLPFGLGYMSDDNDEPSITSLRFALHMRTLRPYSDSHKEKMYEIN